MVSVADLTVVTYLIICIYVNYLTEGSSETSNRTKDNLLEKNFHRHERVKKYSPSLV